MEKEKKKSCREKKAGIREDDLKNLRENSRKLKKAEESLSEMSEKFSGLKDKYLRLAAEFDNYKKRSEKEKKEIYRYGLESFLTQLIPFDDIFESVLTHIEKKPSPEIVHQGLQMLKTEFTKILETAGVEKIASRGRHFDASLHEASGVVETADHEDGEIVEEERVGYLLNGKTLRPALVKVAKKICSTENNDGRNSCSSKD